MTVSAVDCAGAVLDTVPALMRSIRAQMRSHRGADLSVPQLRTLLYLRRNPGAALRSLAEHLGLTPPSASKLVEELVRRRLLARNPSTAARRKIRLEVSPSGGRLLEAVLKKTHEGLAAALAPLPAEDLRAVNRAMAVLRGCFAAGSC